MLLSDLGTHITTRAYISLSPSSAPGWCLTAPMSAASTTANTLQAYPLLVIPCDGSRSQSWSSASSNGLMSAWSGMCVDLAQFSMGSQIINGQTVGAWPCSAGFSQAWVVNGFGQLQSRVSGTALCLDVSDNNTALVTACELLKPSQVWIAQGWSSATQKCEFGFKISCAFLFSQV